MNVMDNIDSVRTNLYNLRNRSLITHLNDDDDISVNLPNGYNYYSSLFAKYFVFSGFLIQPEIPTHARFCSL